MPRKKSVSGRSRGITQVNRLFIQTEKINKQLKRLEQAHRYGTYKSKELIKFVQETPQLSIKKAKGKKRHRVVVNKIKMTTQEYRLISRKLTSISTSKAFTPKGIEKIEEKIRDQITKTLRENKRELGKKLTKQDVEQFYEILEYKVQHNKDSLLQQVEPSLFQDLVNNAIEEKSSKEDFINVLGKYVDINNVTMREEAIKLYNKFIR